MRSKTELITEITRLSRQSKSLEEAITLLQPALAGEIGGSTLLVEPIEEGVSFWAAKSIAGLMDSRVFPFRGLYTAPLMVGRTRVGRLVACFGSFAAPGITLSHLTAHIAQQLGEILGRTRGTPIRYVIPLSYSPTEATR
jgi:hypothetical protein